MQHQEQQNNRNHVEDQSDNYHEDEGNRRRRRSGEEGDDYDENEAIEYGYRHSRREVSWEYRDSSSLTPLQFMDRENCEFIAVNMLVGGIYLAHIMTPLLVMYQFINSLLHQYESMAEVRAQSILYMRVLAKRIGEILHQLVFLMAWMISYGEVALLRAQDLSIYIRHRHHFKPERHRTIDELSRRDCYKYFTISKPHLCLLYRHWRVPNQFRSPHRHVFSGEECFMIYLYHLMTGTPFTKMADGIFGGNPRYFTYMFNAMNDHLYTTFYHKISGISLECWLPRNVHRFRRLVYDHVMDGGLERTTYDEDGELEEITFLRPRISFNEFRIFGLLDDTSIPTGRPGDSARRRRPVWVDDDPDAQRSFYSGYFRQHGLKCQLVYLPNGLIGSVFITELRQNDNGVQNISGLNNYLLRLLHGIYLGGLIPALYCDGIFSLLPTIIPRYTNPTPDQRLLNQRMASTRESIEHIFVDHYGWFKLFWTRQYLHLFDQGVKIRRMCLNSFFIQNCLYCLTGRRCRYFGQMPPSLDEYLPLDEQLDPPPAVDLGDVWEFRSL